MVNSTKSYNLTSPAKPSQETDDEKSSPETGTKIGTGQIPLSSVTNTSDESEVMSSSDNDDVIIDAEDFGIPRKLGFISSVSIIVGTIVGSGIFISPKGVLQSTGSVGLSLIVWVGGGLIALLGGLCYAELGTLIQRSGGEYAYYRKTLGNIPAFLFTWISILVIRPSSLAIMTLTMAEYMATLFSPCADHSAVKKLIATFACLTVGLINSYSTKLAARTIVVTTALKIGALVLILLGGIYMLFKGNTSSLETGFEGSTTSGSVIALAFYDALWAYDGWQNLNYVTEEVKDPGKTLPRAIVAAVLLVTALYTMANISYLTLMTSSELLNAPAVAVLWGDRLLHSAGIIIPICVIISTFGSSCGSAFTGSRSLFAAARDHNLPDVLSYIHIEQRTPIVSMLFSIALAVAMIAAGDISSLIDFFSFVAWLFYGLTFFCLLVLRYTMRDAPRPYKVPIIIPVVMLLLSVYLVIAPIVEDPQIEFLYASLFVLSGLLFYIPFIRFKVKLPGVEKFTIYMQILTETAPTTYITDD